ncbi:hypothetical protein MLD38_039447 [Melastoma candidum]|uniref:Uncharacterized protein n=1 Tax=Melastoma candidum TaxID=119954 RepID=A0ACB9L309_9MYRT|nr:hypothetical protein MLD38_039447 [Melastoma candidum]
MKNSSDDSSRPDRKTIERNRRIHMKGLCFKLSSLIPLPYHNRSKDILSQQDQIDQAAAYITQLKERIDSLKMRKELLMRNNGDQPHVGDYDTAMIDKSVYGSKRKRSALVIDLKEWDSGLDLTVISNENNKCMLYKVISILEEEGTEVVNASVSKVGNKFLHTIQAQVRICRLGVETTRVCQRLEDLACSF